MKSIYHLLVSITMLSVQALSAQIPKTMSYQGVLADAESNPIANGETNLTFRLYDVAEGGQFLWEETQTVETQNGLFNVILGSQTPLDLPFDAQYWLGITAGEESEMRPRTALTASPYSLNSTSALAEPVPGQSLAIRNENGEVTHEFNSNGDAMHYGTGTFRGGLVVGDTLNVDDTTGVIATLNENSTKGNTKVQQNQLPLYGQIIKADGIGLIARAGITGIEARGGFEGVKAFGEDIGLTAESNNIGIHSKQKIKVDEVPEAPNQERFLVWDTDNIIKHRTLEPTGEGMDCAVCEDEALKAEVLKAKELSISVPGSTTEFRLDRFSLSTTINKDTKKIKQTIGGENADVSIEQTENDNPESPNKINSASTAPTGLAVFYPNPDLGTKVGLQSEVRQTTGSAIVGAKTLPVASNAAKKSPNGMRSFSFPEENNSVSNVSLNATAQQNSPAIWGITQLDDGTAMLGQITSTNNTSPAVWGFHSGAGSGVVASVAGNGTALIADYTGNSGNIAEFRSGSVNQIRFDKTGKGFFNGGTQTGGADIAEAFEAEDLVTNYEPGDVIAISLSNDRTVTKSSEPYSSLVIGVYATKPGVLLTERSIDDSIEDTIPVGVVGIIPTKVSGENGAIRRGDLLVAASLPGHAMKGTECDKMLGATIGKALEEFDGNGEGLIKVLVNVK